MFLGKTKTSIEGNEIVIRIQISSEETNPQEPKPRYRVETFRNFETVSYEFFYSMQDAYDFYGSIIDTDRNHFYKKRIVEMRSGETIEHDWGTLARDGGPQ